MRTATTTTPSPTSHRRFGVENDTVTPTPTATIGVAVQPSAQRQVSVGRRNDRQRSASIVSRCAWLHHAKPAIDTRYPDTSSCRQRASGLIGERRRSGRAPGTTARSPRPRRSATTVANRRALDAEGRSIGGCSSPRRRSAYSRGGNVVDDHASSSGTARTERSMTGGGEEAMDPMMRHGPRRPTGRHAIMTIS